MPDVVTHLRQRLPVGSTATLLAIDGSTTEDVMQQVVKLSPDVNRVAVSMGGNDALLHADALDLPVSSTREALALFGERLSAFESSYRAALAEIVERVPHTAVSPIYNGNLSSDEPSSQGAKQIAEVIHAALGGGTVLEPASKVYMATTE